MTLFSIKFITLLIILGLLSGICSANQPNVEAEQIRENALQFSRVWKRDKLEEAAALFFKLSEIYANQDKSRAAEALRESSKIRWVLGDPEIALTLLRSSLKIERNSRNIDGEADTLSQIAYIEANLGNYRESSKYLNELLKIQKEIKSRKVQADVIYNLGETYFARQDIPKFLEYYPQALQIYKELGEQRGEARTLWSLAYAHLANDDLQAGLEYALESLKKWQEIGEERGITLSLLAVGLSYFRLGKSTEALIYLDRANKAFPDDIDRIEKGILFNNTGRVYESLGDCGASISNFEKAAEIFDTAQNLSFAIGNLGGLGSVSYKCGFTDKSIGYLQKALEIAKQTRSNHEIMYIQTELGDIFAKENSFSKSEFNFKEALNIDESDKYKLDKSRALSGLGRLYLKFNKPKQALSNYLSSLSIALEIKDRFSTAETLFELAKFYSLNNEPEKSIECVQKSIEMTENLYADVVSSKLKRTYLSNVFDRYELYIKLLMKKHRDSSTQDFNIQALQLTERSRARSLLEKLSLSEADFTKDADPETIKRENEIRVLLNSKADKLTDLLSQNAEKAETDKISIEINQLENELENIKAKLKHQSPIYSAIKNPAPFDVGEFQQNILDENSLLLEFSFGEEQSYLWLVGKNSVNSFVLPPRKEIETHIEKLRQLLASREMKKDEKLEDFQLRIREDETLYQTEAKLLSNQLFGQIGDQISNKRLIIVPDGKLHYFPVSALPLPASDSDEPLLTTNETVYAPSAQTLLILEKSRKQNAVTSKNLLIFSDPIFTSDDSRFFTIDKSVEDSNAETNSTDSFRFVESLNSLPRLTASKNESDAILDIIGTSNADGFSGFEANRAQLLKISAGDYKIIHFATHGITDEKRPELSGIVLSRFNEERKKQDEFFRIHDIYGLNLNADLVVLSACETGIGKEVKGEGLMSLNNAFLQSGSKTVMASLWKVEDNATQELMKNFYRGIVDEKLTPSQSLRTAQMELRKNSQFKSPFYWAAFTVQGDFRNVPKISKRFGNPLYLFAFIPLVLVVFYLFRKRKTLVHRSNS